METTDKDSCNIICSLLQQHGVVHAVVSPGSRNAPLIVALARCASISKTIIIDERSAAFIALGIASMLNKPVALVCTSGTALLNYAPAIAEAYYRKLPLIVISADRPYEWIDQDDSQTLRQYEALSNYVKSSYDIPDQCNNETTRWYINRIINDALITANSGRKSPVHINIQLDEPLNRTIKHKLGEERKIELLSPDNTISDENLSPIIHKLTTSQKILIIAGFSQPDTQLNNALATLSRQKNITILTESISNLKCNKFITSIDRTLSIMSEAERNEMYPDIVITLGGALISRHIKQYLRSLQNKFEHWHVGLTNTTIDCFKSLTKRIEILPSAFFSRISSIIKQKKIQSKSDYAEQWRKYATFAKEMHSEYLKVAQWSDLKALDIVFKTLPNSCNIQLSNGTVVRYAQLFDTSKFIRSDCNRGVSGIDGCTSTAIGASLTSKNTTVLITGDMSAQYDIGALAANCISPRFKMIVINNGGGGIFRFVQSTSTLPELEEYFVASPQLPLRQLASGYGFKFFEASNSKELKSAIKHFISENVQPAILQINTPGKESADVLTGYFNRKQILNNK